MRKAALKRDNAPRIAALPRGERHWNWSVKPILLTLHKRIHRRYGKASAFRCSTRSCENRARDWANMTGKYTDKIEDYSPLCRSCHVKRDKNWKKK